LLSDVREFMRDETAARLSSRFVPPGAEDNVVADGVSACIEITHRLTGIHSDLREVMAEALFHIQSKPRFKRAARTSKDV
jgi:hypothetical protein